MAEAEALSHRLEEMEDQDLVLVVLTLMELYQEDQEMREDILLLKVMMVETLHFLLEEKLVLVVAVQQTPVLIDQAEMDLLEEMELRIQ